MGLTGFFLFSTTPVLNQLSLPAWYSRCFQFWFEQQHFSLAAVALLVVVALETAAGRRLWCRYICPQSVMISLAKQINARRLNVTFDAKACICKSRHNDPCTRSCSLDLDPKGLKCLPETECTNCGDCVVECQKRGKALRFKFGRSGR
ncbi:MAG: 4Fe-4S binding protein [Desulfobacteraceae bacterium]